MRIEKVEFVKSAYSPKDLLKNSFPEVVFAGRSNVGKSSLINTLLRRKGIAKTSSTPGKTVNINYILVNSKYHFVDLPGYGYAKASSSDRQRWLRLVESYFANSDAIRLVIHLADIRRGRTDLDLDLDTWLMELGFPFCLILTKSDKLKHGQRKQALDAVRREMGKDIPVLAVSSQTGIGMKELWSVVDSRL